MIGGLPLAFAQPLVLLGLLALPVLWWLLRLVPPRPRRIAFPPLRLLFDIVPREETPSRTPWWLTLLRLLLAALVILAAAGPQWNPNVATLSSRAPLALLIDDGFAAAATWEARLRSGDEMLARAEADNRNVALIPVSEAARGIELQEASVARMRLRKLQPKSHAVMRNEALPALERVLGANPDLDLVWLSDGVDLGDGTDFVSALSRLLNGRAISVVTGGLPPARALNAANNAAAELTVQVLRGSAPDAESGFVRALDMKGLLLGEAPYHFAGDAREAEARFTLPLEIRNDIARLEIAGEKSAGAVQLLDTRWRRRSVGVITGATAETAQPLLASTYYLSRALSPFADMRMAEGISPSEAVLRFLDQKVPVIILADVGTMTDEARTKLAAWIGEGGLLVRFAGPRLAASDDDLVPVRLRRGGRILGGSLSWEQPQALSAFPREGAFAGMAVPQDVTVSRQVLAEPEAGLSERTWAALADGTPLVTAAKRGKGLVVLFHVTADTRWSDLPLSGAFVDMLRRIVALSGMSAAAEEKETGPARETLPAARVLDGFGAFTAPHNGVKPVPANFAARATADHPPGFYGPPEGLLAVNTLTPQDRLLPLAYAGLNARHEAYRLSEPLDLRGPILLATLGLLLIDAVIVFLLSGGIARLARKKRPATAMLLLAAFVYAVTAMPVAAQSSQADDFAMQASLQTRLAYIVTGNAEVDAVSKAGLEGLTLFMAQRTALEAGDPVGLDPERDELSFFPLIYWPVAPEAQKPSPQALARIDAYMKQGGTVLFDTRDAILAPPGPGGETQSPGMAALREIIGALDIPELEPVPDDHVLTKTFYLLRGFPGRFDGGQLWVEAMPAADEFEEDENPRPARAGDGVSSIMITSNDLAGAWAIRSDGQAMLPIAGNEIRQREMAFRAGTNIMMYALTGNYKADQVHIPALLERLGQ